MDEAVLRIAGAWELILPEIVLITTACVCFLVGPFLAGEGVEAPAGLRHRWGGLALASLVTAGWLWWGSTASADGSPLGPFRADALAWFTRGLAIAAGAILLLTGWNRIGDARAAEHHACLLLIVAGVSLVGAANDLVTLFLALELVSIPTYVLLYLGRSDASGQEAVLKYFLLSVFSSAMVLFGLSYLYGIAGTTNLTALYDALSRGGSTPALFVAVAALIAGLAFRITTAPFHFYAPDVFQGCSTSGAAMLSFVPKIAGFVALLRLLSAPGAAGLRTLGESAEPILWALAVVSMTVGNVLALLQTDVRRMMAYSSIAHAGYMLVGLAAAPHDGGAVRGVPALLFYLVAYGAMTVGVFAVLAALRSNRQEDDRSAGGTLDDLAGLSVTHPAAALLMTIFLFSLTGLPPTAGFLGKLNLLLAAWSAGTSAAQWTAAVMALNAAIGAWYYLRLVGVMYLQPSPAAARSPVGPPAFLGAVACAAATVLLFVAPDWLWQAAAEVSG